MTTKENDEFAEQVIDYFRPLFSGEAMRVLLPVVLKELAEGEPVAPARIAQQTGIPVDRVIELIHQGLPVEWDDKQRIIGSGISLHAVTPYRFIVNGRSLWVWCAADSLLFPTVIGLSARIESPCFVTGEPIVVEVTADSLERVEPPDAVMSIATPKVEVDVSSAHDVHELLCSGNKFFASAEVAVPWQAEHPDAAIVKVSEGHKLFVSMARQFYGGRFAKTG